MVPKLEEVGEGEEGHNSLRNIGGSRSSDREKGTWGEGEGVQ